MTSATAVMRCEYQWPEPPLAEPRPMHAAERTAQAHAPPPAMTNQSTAVSTSEPRKAAQPVLRATVRSKP